MVIKITCFYLFSPHCAAYRILVPQPEIEPMSSAVEGQNLNPGPQAKSPKLSVLILKASLSIHNILLIRPVLEDGFAEAMPGTEGLHWKYSVCL